MAAHKQASVQSSTAARQNSAVFFRGLCGGTAGPLRTKKGRTRMESALGSYPRAGEMIKSRLGDHRAELAAKSKREDSAKSQQAVGGRFGNRT